MNATRIDATLANVRDLLEEFASADVYTDASEHFERIKSLKWEARKYAILANQMLKALRKFVGTDVGK